jgi:hypothetical protein
VEQEAPAVAAMSYSEVQSLQEELGLQVCSCGSVSLFSILHVLAPTFSINTTYPPPHTHTQHKHNHQATGRGPPKPIRSFTEAGFGDTLLKEIVKRGFEAPTAIQVGIVCMFVLVGWLVG